MRHRNSRTRLLSVMQLEDRTTPATFTWDGGGADDNWSTANNWLGDVAPTAADTGVVIVFNTADATTVQDITGLDIDQLNFEAGADITLTLSTDLTINGVSGTPSIVDATGQNTITGAGDLVLAGAPVGIDTPGTSGQLVVDAQITGGVGLVKSGAGRLTLNGANTYVGDTTVVAGVLEVNGIQTSSSVTLTLGTLGGSGTVGALTTVAGTVAPALSSAVVPVLPFTLGTGNLILAGSNFTSVMTGTGVDQLNVTGTVNLTGASLTVNRVGIAVLPGSSFTLINNDGTDAVTGTFTGFAQGAVVPVNGQNFIIDYTGGTGNDVVLTLAGGSGANLAISGQANGSATLYTPDAAGHYSAGATLTPFAGFTGNVRTAVADVNNDGTEDTILVTGPGTPIRVAVISGIDNTTVLVAPFDPFGGNFTGGGFVSAGNIDGLGGAEYAVTPDQGGGPRVTIFSLIGGVNTERANFFGIDDPNFRGGARSAIGDTNADGTPDLAVAAGFLGGPRVALFNGTTLFTTPTRLTGDFFSFPGPDAVRLRNGAYVAIGDINGDGAGDLIFGGGPGGAPRVFILDGALVSAGLVAGAQAAPISSFFVAGNSVDRGGVRVAAKDADGDAKADLVVGSGEGSPANARIYLGANFINSGEPSVFQDIPLFGGGPLAGGVYVG